MLSVDCNVVDYYNLVCWLQCCLLITMLLSVGCNVVCWLQCCLLIAMLPVDCNVVCWLQCCCCVFYSSRVTIINIFTYANSVDSLIWASTLACVISMAMLLIPRILTLQEYMDVRKGISLVGGGRGSKWMAEKGGRKRKWMVVVVYAEEPDSICQVVTCQ